jgi:hypothetical protein
LIDINYFPGGPLRCRQLRPQAPTARAAATGCPPRPPTGQAMLPAAV